jgi:SAM-dependent methyltransferase
MDVSAHNRLAWDREASEGSPCSIPVSPEQISAARRGDWRVFVTQCTPIPKAWLPEVIGRRILCLAAGGGQQAPILAAAGGIVSVLDISPVQLARDRFVAQREGLAINIVEGNMQALEAFEDGIFDVVIHPASNHYASDIRAVWREASRVLQSGGTLISGFINPVAYALDMRQFASGILQLRHKLPYSDLTSISTDERTELFGLEAPIEFGHTFADQFAGQIESGFVIDGFFEDFRRNDLLNKCMPTYFATRASKLRPL